MAKSKELSKEQASFFKVEWEKRKELFKFKFILFRSFSYIPPSYIYSKAIGRTESGYDYEQKEVSLTQIKTAIPIKKLIQISEKSYFSNSQALATT